MSRFRHRFICYLLLFSTVTTPPLAFAQRPAARQGQHPHLAYVTANSALAGIVFPHRVLTAPELEMLPIEVFSAAGVKELGIDPVDIESLVVMVEPPGQGPPGFGAVVKFTKPFAVSNLSAKLVAGLEEQEYRGRPYLKSAHPLQPSILLLNDKTLVVASERIMQEIIAGKRAADGNDVQKIIGTATESFDLHVALSLESIRPLIDMQLSQTPDLPEPFHNLKQAPALIASAELRLLLTGGNQTSDLLVHAIDEAAAEQLADIVDQVLTAGQRLMMEEVAKQPQSDDPVERAAQQYANRFARHVFDQLRPERQGKTLTLRSAKTQTTQAATIGILIALLLPAVNAARAAARRNKSINNMRQLGLSILNYESTRGHFPARASFDDDGNPLLSWRVHMLPFLEDGALYDEFHLDEPWDSAHNKQLIERMPNVFQSPNSSAEAGRTTYLLPVGPGTMFEGQEPINIREIRDGLSKTLMLMEVSDDEAVVWTKPQDWKYDPEDPTRGLVSLPGGVFLGTFADCACRSLSLDIDPQTLTALFEYADGRNANLQH